MESWRKVWREGLLPFISTKGLEALRDGLIADDARLTQGSTTTPPPLMCVQDWPVEAACTLGYSGWKGDGLETVGEVEEHFARMCFECDNRMGEPAACRWFLNWFDDTPRDEMRRELLAEVELALAQREPQSPGLPNRPGNRRSNPGRRRGHEDAAGTTGNLRVVPHQASAEGDAQPRQPRVPDEVPHAPRSLADLD
jgi:hypothetical protein